LFGEALDIAKDVAGEFADIDVVVPLLVLALVATVSRRDAASATTGI